MREVGWGISKHIYMYKTKVTNDLLTEVREMS